MPPEQRRMPAEAGAARGGPDHLRHGRWRLHDGAGEPRPRRLRPQPGAGAEPRICLLPTAGGDSEDQIRRFHTAFDDQLCEPTHISLFRLGLAPGAAARPPARAGRDLRRRRLDDQPARAVARARARRDPARGVAGRHRARRAERRVDVLVRVGRDEVDRPPDARARPRVPARLELRPLRRRAGPPARVPRGGRAAASPGRLGASTTAPGCCSAAPGWPRPSPPGRAPRLPVHAVDGAAVEEAIEPRLLKARPHADPASPLAVDEMRALRRRAAGWRRD